MAKSAKFLALVVLVQLYGAGLAATVKHVPASISHEPGQTDITAKDARIVEMPAKDARIDDMTAKEARIDEMTAKDARIVELTAKDARIDEMPAKDARIGGLTLGKVTWTYSSMDSIMTVCTVEPFVEADQTVSQVTLLKTIGDGNQEACEGEFNQLLKNCAIFRGSLRCKIDVPAGEEYTLNLQVDVQQLPAVEVNKHAQASFTMTVAAATLKCGSTSFIRATGMAGASIDSYSCVAPGVEGVCYQVGDLNLDPFCFHAADSDQDNLDLCLEGGNSFIQDGDGVLDVTQLAYTPAGSATFSLTLTGSDVNPFEAIVIKENVPLRSCSVTPFESSGECSIPDFTGDHAKYEVCTIIPTPKIQTALSSITDLDVQAEFDDSLLQFRFTNANLDKKYKATLLDNDPGATPPAVTIDCTGVTQDHICYGFLDKKITATFLTIEYLTADETNPSNKIAILYPVFPRL